MIKNPGAGVAGSIAPGAFGNPTASVGLTAVNGSATTAMRSDGAPALDVTISPTWTGTHTFSATEPRILLKQTGAGANLKLWDFDVAATVLTGRTRTDADGAGKNWLAVTRGATTAIGDISFGNATDNPTYNFLGTGVMVVNGYTAFQANMDVVGAFSAGSVTIASPDPLMSWYDSNAAANTKFLFMELNSGVFKMMNWSDDYVTQKTFFQMTRTTTTVTDISLGNATDNPTFQFLGTSSPKHGSTTLLQTSVNLTNGAAAQVATMTNGPTAGNPTKWVPINDNGTTRYIPAW